MFHATSVLAMKVGVPSAENTAPMKVEATSRIITMLEVCAVRKTESLNTAQVSLPVRRGYDQRTDAAERCALGRRGPAGDDRAERGEDQRCGRDQPKEKLASEHADRNIEFLIG